MRWIFILLFLTSCGQYSQWHYQNIPTKETLCSRLIYQSKDPIQGIDLQFLNFKDDLSIFLQVHSHPLEDEKICIITEDKEIFIAGNLHNGKQRIQLSHISKEILIKMLQEKKPLTIELKGYKETINPEKFESYLKKLEKPPFKIPLHLPF